MERIDNPNLMEPLLPPEGVRMLEDLAVELVSKASCLAGKISNDTVASISDLVRSMNCYYSNLIEGHNTNPVDIERALAGDYSHDQKKRNLQLEAHAHIEVQRVLDQIAKVETMPSRVVSVQFILWLHGEFCSKLPPELLKNRDPNTGDEVSVVPGTLRTNEVIVGNHLAPVADALPGFLALFEERFNPQRLSKLMRIIAVAASHHRLLWIHPFLDGNGRVARLFSHAFLREIGMGNSLWSVSRGLARYVQEYKMRLADADSWREGDTDGRGSLSLRALNSFCEFFLTTCIDQVDFMDKLLDPSTLIERVRRYCSDQLERKKLPRGSFELLREVILCGEVPRSRVITITGYQERQSRSIVSALFRQGLLKSPTQRGNLALNIPFEVVETWFPRLYPAELDT